MVGQSGKPYGGVDLGAASRMLAGVRPMALDVDWLAGDSSGCFGIFLGDDSTTYRLPTGADPIGASKLIETIRTTFDARTVGTSLPTYRHAAHSDTGEPIFDLPRRSDLEPLHEPRFSGYPHLFVASDNGAAAIRDAMIEYGGREVSSRGAFAASIPIGALTYDFLHETGACEGCRVLDPADDPRPRSPEMLATLGFFVYGYAGGMWLRIVIPSMAADLHDLERLGASRTGRIAFDGRFDDSPWLRAG